MANLFKVDDRDVLEGFRKLKDEVRGEALADSLLAGGMVVLDAARQNILAQKLWQTRNLSRSLHQLVTEKSDTRAAVDIGTDLEYAAIHEYGGVITPKNARYLAIPMKGVTGSPRDRDDLKLVKTGRGNLVLVDESGVQFVLKESVSIPAQPYLRPALEENKEAVVEEIKAALDKIIDAAWEK